MSNLLCFAGRRKLVPGLRVVAGWVVAGPGLCCWWGYGGGGAVTARAWLWGRHESLQRDERCADGQGGTPLILENV